MNEEKRNSTDFASQGDAPAPQEKDVAAADVVFPAIVMILSVLAFYHAYGMRVPQTMLDAPGLFPMVMSSLIFLTAVVVFVNGIRNRGWQKLKRFWSQDGAIKGNVMLIRALVISALMLLYVYVLIPELPYFVASFVFLIALMLFLRSTKIIYIVVIAAVASYAIYYLFRHALNIPLP